MREAIVAKTTIRPNLTIRRAALPFAIILGSCFYANFCGNQIAGVMLEKSSSFTVREVGNKNSSQLQEIEFRQDMDLITSSRLECGHYKCFVPSLTDEQIGYLVASNHLHLDLAKLNESYNTAKWIERDFGAKHFYHDDPPFEIELPKKVQRKINQMAYWVVRGRLHRKFTNSPVFVVQKVIKAPEEVLLFGCVSQKIKHYVKEMEEFSKIVCKNGSADDFITNSEKSYAIAEKLFKTRPILFYQDFQVMIDPRGDYYYLDLDLPSGDNEDSGYWKEVVREGQSCLDRLKNIGKDFSDRLDRGAC